jgi:hypothetical protein
MYWTDSPRVPRFDLGADADRGDLARTIVEILWSTEP